jgi:ATP-binding protein involved in chromosome partitioning
MQTYHDITHDGGSDISGQVRDLAIRMGRRLKGVDHVIAVMSGKGGVGKSSLTANLAAVLAENGSVGIIDGDINGPSLGRMTGVHGRHLQRGLDSILPAMAGVDSKIKVMSMDLFLEAETAPVLWKAPTQRDGFAWRGLMEAGALREFISDTEWGELDYLFIDLPPGSDKLPNLADILPQLSGAVVVTLPAAVSLGVVGRSIRMARELLDTPILGLVENMSRHTCPSCGHIDQIFPAGGLEKLSTDLQVPILGSVPFDPLIGSCADEGKFYVSEYPDRPAAAAIHGIAEKLTTML